MLGLQITDTNGIIFAHAHIAFPTLWPPRVAQPIGKFVQGFHRVGGAPTVETHFAQTVKLAAVYQLIYERDHFRLELARASILAAVLFVPIGPIHLLR